MRNLSVWSNWFALNPASYITARWIKRGQEITVELLNSKDVQMSAQFAANFCGDNFKSVNGWHMTQLPSRKSAFLNIKDGSADRCNDGFHLWYRNLRGPQIIDEGTELLPAGNE